VATVIGDSLPPLLLERLHAQSAILESTAIPICTIDPEGFPHPAMLSYAELTADDARCLRAAVYGASSTARHLRARGTIALLFVDPEGTYYVKATVRGPDAPHPTSPTVAVFLLGVVAVLADSVDPTREPAAVITSGIQFRRTAPQPSLPRASL
jgi:Pyridoxamine 5'-phosphate oxidase